MSYSSCCSLRNRPAESSHSATPMMRTLDWGSATQAGGTTLRKRRASISSMVRSRGFQRNYNRANRSVARAESNGERQSRGPAQATQDDGWRRTSGYDYPPRTNTIGSTQDWNGPPPPGPPGGGPEYGQGGGRNFTPALLAAAFVVGLGTGVWFDSEVNLEPQNVASTEILDRRTPSSEVCMANGYSAMVFDQRIFVSFNPFNVYVTQPEVKPGCVLRRSNYNVLENRKLISNREVDSCKRGMNTFAFVGDLEQRPEISCVYHSEEAENQYLINPKRAVMGDGYQAREIQD